MDQPRDYQDPSGEREYGLHRCSFDPDVETGLACGRCARYICPRCMIQTPVGARCPECARVRKLPTFDVQPSYYVRAVVAGGVVAVVGGVAWGLLLRAAPIPFLPWLLGIGVGYLVGETVSVASNRKRGTGLAVVAGASMAIAFVAMLLVSPPLNIIGLLLMLAAGIYVAVNRVR